MEKWQKAILARLKVETRAAELGATVSVPTTDARYDLVIDWDGRLFRAQVKYAGGTPSSSLGAVVAELRKEGRKYQSHEVDVVLVYIPKIDRVLVRTRNIS